MPDFALFLTADETTIVNRLLDIPKITEEYEKLAEARRQELAEQKARERQEKIDAGEELEEEEEEQEEEEDPDAPNLQNMIDEERTKITARREADLGFIEEVKELFEAKNIAT